MITASAVSRIPLQVRLYLSRYSPVIRERILEIINERKDSGRASWEDMGDVVSAALFDFEQPAMPPRNPEADALAREAYRSGRVRSVREIVYELRSKMVLWTEGDRRWYAEAKRTPPHAGDV